jgi:hypothetical protein
VIEALKVWLVHALTEWRTHALEVALVGEVLVAGLWLWWPGPNGFTDGTLLGSVPDVALGGLLVVHGIGGGMALWKNNVHMCRRSALASASLWTFVLATFCYTPPSDLILVPIVFGLAVASLWVYLRLYLLYPPKGMR